MTRKEIVKELRCLAAGEDCPSEKCDKTCPYWTGLELGATLSDDRQLCCAAADMLEQDVPGWISVKDRLPEDDATYLVYGRNGYGIVFAIYYGDGEWLTCDDLTNITRFVAHWMPLPEPPKEEAK